MRSRLVATLTVAALLLLTVVVARGPSAIRPGVLDPMERGQSRPEYAGPERAGPDLLGGIGRIGMVVLLTVMVLFVIVMVLTALQRARRRRRGVGLARPRLADLSTADPADPSAVQLRGAVRDARAELRRRAGGPPADAVIAAWVRLERLAATAGSARAAHQTPTEFTSALLTRHGVDEPAVAALRGLYHRARFGPAGALGAADAVAAGDALDGIESALVGS